jgi:hypothetical protein
MVKKEDLKIGDIVYTGSFWNYDVFSVMITKMDESSDFVTTEGIHYVDEHGNAIDALKNREIGEYITDYRMLFATAEEAYEMQNAVPGYIKEDLVFEP